MMKRLFPLLMLIFFLIPASSALAEGSIEDPELYLLCRQQNSEELLPECPLFSAEYELRLAEEKAETARNTLVVHQPDNAYGETDILYAKLITDKAAVYGSLEDAVSRSNPKRYFYDGFNYVSYTEKVYLEGKVYYYIGRSEWMRGADLNPNVYPIPFSGLIVENSPGRPFGWVLLNSPTYMEPGYGSQRTGSVLPRHSLVEVYDTKVIKGWDWYLIGDGQWIEQRKLALVFPKTEPPFGVENGRWIDINLFEQTAAVYEDNQLIYAALTTTGSPEFFTRPGLFKIWLKLESTSMRGGDEDDKYYLEDVLWTMYFDEARGLHGEYWHDHLGYKSSHGCVNLAYADADWLFQWAEEGDWVYVWDPSGYTPVEPHLFTHLILPPLPAAFVDFMPYEME